MRSADDDMRASLLAALRRPANVDDWVTGAHYTSSYLPQLERAAHASTTAALAATASLSSSLSTRTASTTSRAPRHTSKARARRPLATVAAAAADNVADATLTSKVADADAVTTTTTAVASAADASAHHGEALARRRRLREATARTPSSRCAALLTPRLGEDGLSAQEVRAQLCESYYCMKRHNAFGHTFPALLTPLTRSLMHYYTEDEWALRTHRTATAAAASSSYDTLTDVSHTRCRAAMRSGGATGRACVMTERSMSSTMSTAHLSRLARASWRTADTASTRDDGTLATASMTL